MTVFRVNAVDATGRVVCERCRVADNPLTRLRGLIGRRELPAGEAWRGSIVVGSHLELAGRALPAGRREPGDRDDG